MMDFHRCIGCRYCMAGCPYGSRSFNWRDPRPFIKKINPDFPTRTKGVVEKCNFCVGRLAQGSVPAHPEDGKGFLRCYLHLFSAHPLGSLCLSNPISYWAWGHRSFKTNLL